jgi:transcriptional repressor NrdR
VIDSRAAEDGYSIRRRRECLHCHRRYTTYEQIDESSIKIVKKGGRREPFDARKLREGITKACWKRPVSELQIDGIIAGVQDQIFTSCDNEIDSSLLGEFVMQALKEIDQVAYIRFASVYREFQDVRDFVEEMAPMLEEEDWKES